MIPAAAAASRPSRNGKNASLAHTPPVGAAGRPLGGDARRVEPVLLAGTDAERLPILGVHDRVAADRRAHLPRELEVAPLLVVGSIGGDDPPVGAVDADHVGLLHEEPAVDRAHVERQRCRERSADSTRRFFFGQHRQRVVVERGRDDDLGEHRGERGRQRGRHRAGSAATMPPNALTGSHALART